MTHSRHLSWEGCKNVRDLGGLRTHDGRVTRWGAVVRADHPSKLSAAGWEALRAHGVCTVVSLRTDGLIEESPDVAPRPSGLTTVSAAIEDFEDADFVQQWVVSNLWCTPLYYRDALQRWPQRHAAAIAAVAHAPPGGVLVHCGRGHDRTGIITLLLLALAGVTPEEIAADYALSIDPDRDELLAQRNTSSAEVICDTLAQLDVAAYLRSGGLSEAELDAVRARLLG
ncbi:MAG TPA: tyrosine-protein phosphatase [Roseiflexaceae bacterium]|nr:tyrosine-protein phosphatase [Roseiflexaceae bacterium]